MSTTTADETAVVLTAASLSRAAEAAATVAAELVRAAALTGEVDGIRLGPLAKRAAGVADLVRQAAESIR